MTGVPRRRSRKSVYPDIGKEGCGDDVPKGVVICCSSDQN